MAISFLVRRPSPSNLSPNLARFGRRNAANGNARYEGSSLLPFPRKRGEATLPRTPRTQDLAEALATPTPGA